MTTAMTGSMGLPDFFGTSTFGLTVEVSSLAGIFRVGWALAVVVSD